MLGTQVTQHSAEQILQSRVGATEIGCRAGQTYFCVTRAYIISYAALSTFMQYKILSALRCVDLRLKISLLVYYT